MSAVLLSENDIHSALGDGLAIEYTRDSPLFRQQISAFVDSFQGLPDYCKNVVECLEDVDRSYMMLKESNSKLAVALAGREGGFSRCLFTNAYPLLGDLSETLRMVADALIDINGVHEQQREILKNDVTPIFEELAREDLSYEKSIQKKMEKGFEDYEYKLGNALLSRHQLSPRDTEDITLTRRDYELARFDLVSRLNQIDAKKKVLLTQAACNLHITFSQTQEQIREKLSQSSDIINELGNATIESSEMLIKKDSLWTFIRSKLQGELMGAMPPPGAPPGALSPVQPRWHPGMTVYTATITTEVLSHGSRSATYEDMRHARDDGVFKQGYLFVSTGLLGFRKRKWHRLYTSKMYIVEAVPGAPSCNMDVVCDIANSSVVAKPGKTPHKFRVTLPSGKKYDFQAENDDELVKWISAIKRCASSTNLGRPKDHRHAAMILQQQKESGIVPPRELRDGPAAQHLRAFLDGDNNFCAECGTEGVSWISMSLGVTCCEDCASIHRQLSWAVSKLKNIQLDDFHVWQIKMLDEALGNKIVNSIWEQNAPAGWAKPDSNSSLEERSRWITAKYRWYGFVDDECHVRTDEQLAEGMMKSIRRHSVYEMLWWSSHKAVVNCEYPTGSGHTPLHEALLYQNPIIIGYLLMNGADMYAQEGKDGETPLSIVENPSFVNQPPSDSTPYLNQPSEVPEPDAALNVKPLCNYNSKDSRDKLSESNPEIITEMFAQILRGEF